MLYQLGALTLESVRGTGLMGTDRQATADFAAKPDVGTTPPREFMGPGDVHIVLQCRLLPHFMARHGQPTGLDDLDLLEQMRVSGAPYVLIRGDGLVLGWWLLEHVSERGQLLDDTGIARSIDLEIALVKSSVSANADAALPVLNLLVNGLENTADAVVKAGNSLTSSIPADHPNKALE